MPAGWHLPVSAQTLVGSFEHIEAVHAVLVVIYMPENIVSTSQSSSLSASEPNSTNDLNILVSRFWYQTHQNIRLHNSSLSGWVASGSLWSYQWELHCTYAFCKFSASFCQVVPADFLPLPGTCLAVAEIGRNPAVCQQHYSWLEQGRTAGVVLVMLLLWLMHSLSAAPSR